MIAKFKRCSLSEVEGTTHLCPPPDDQPLPLLLLQLRLGPEPPDVEDRLINVVKNTIAIAQII